MDLHQLQIRARSFSDAFTLLGLVGPNSNSFGNWQAADQGTWSGNNLSPPITVSSFNLYVIAVSATLASSGTHTVGGKGAATFTVDLTQIPIGSYAIAWGQNDTHAYTTAFTEAGQFTKTDSPAVPVPPSAVLLGIGGLGCALMLFNRRRHAVAVA